MNFALKSTRGRFQDSFDDPAWRMRAWFWLDGAKKAKGCRTAKALDDLRLFSSDRVSGLFQRIEEDGFNPRNMTAVGTTSILDFLEKSKQFPGLCANFKHPFWGFLHAREGIKVVRQEELTRLLDYFQLIRIDARDAGHLSDLGVSWPEISDESECTVNTLNDLAYLGKLDSLDGILLLLLLYRESIDHADLSGIEMLGPLLLRTANTLSKGWSGEMRDTWEFLLRSRMLTWLPDMQPSKLDMLRSHAQLTELWEQSPKQARGRPRMHPDKLGYGKAERRWRRRVWMRAAGRVQHWKKRWIGFLPRNEFTQWLHDERALMERHFAQAEMIIVGATLEDLDKESRLLFEESLPPLTIPVDKTHVRCRPYRDTRDRHEIDEQPYDIIPVIEKKLDKKQ